MTDVGELSPYHLLFVLVIALIVLGPGKLPEVGAALGKTIRAFRTASSNAPDAGLAGDGAPSPPGRDQVTGDHP